MIGVLIMADSVIGQIGLEAIIEAEADLVIVDRVKWASALTQSEKLSQGLAQTDVLVLAVVASEQNLRQIAELLGRLQPSSLEPPAVVWLAETTTDWTLAALRSGILGILPPDASTEAILATIEAAAAGLMVIHPDSLDLTLALPQATLPARPTAQITQREAEILQMLAAGLANKAIARQLQISEHTVKFHLGSIFSKLGVRSRTEAVISGVRLGLVLL